MIRLANWRPVAHTDPSSPDPSILEGYNSADKPTLYFTYLLEVEADDDYNPLRSRSATKTTVSASSVPVTTGSGNCWQPTMHSEIWDFADEYDYFNDTNIPVQELFDDRTEMASGPRRSFSACR